MGSIRISPTSFSIDSAEKRKFLAQLAYQRATDLLDRMSTVYTSTILAPNYALSIKFLAELAAQYQDGIFDILNDYEIETTRSDFLFQKHGYITHFQDPKFFPTQILDIEWPPRSGQTIQVKFPYEDGTYRDFLKSLLLVLLQGTTPQAMIDGAAIFTDLPVEVLEYSKFLNRENPDYPFDVDKMHEWLYLVELDPDTINEVPLQSLVEGLAFLVDLNKPAHTFASVALGITEQFNLQVGCLVDLGATGKILASQIVVDVSQDDEVTQPIVYEETPTLTGLGSEILPEPGIVAETLVVTDLTETTEYTVDVDYVLDQSGIDTKIARIDGSNITSGQTILVRYQSLYIDGVTGQYATRNVITGITVVAGDITEMVVGTGTTVVLDGNTEITDQTGAILPPNTTGINVGTLVEVFGQAVDVDPADFNDVGMIKLLGPIDDNNLCEQFSVTTCTYNVDCFAKCEQEFENEFTIVDEDLSAQFNNSHQHDTYYVTYKPIVVGDGTLTADWNGISVTVLVNGLPVVPDTINPINGKIVLPLGSVTDPTDTVVVSYTYGLRPTYALYGDTPECLADSGPNALIQFIADSTHSASQIITKIVSGELPSLDYEDLVLTWNGWLDPRFDDPTGSLAKTILLEDWQPDTGPGPFEFTYEHSLNIDDLVVSVYSNLTTPYTVENIDFSLIDAHNLVLSVPNQVDEFDGKIVIKPGEFASGNTFVTGDWVGAGPSTVTINHSLATTDILVDVYEDTGVFEKKILDVEIDSNNVFLTVPVVGDIFDGKISLVEADSSIPFVFADWVGIAPFTVTLPHGQSSPNILLRVYEETAPGVFEEKTVDTEVTSTDIIITVQNAPDKFEGKVVVVAAPVLGRAVKQVDTPIFENLELCDPPTYHHEFEATEIEYTSIGDSVLGLITDSRDVVRGLADRANKISASSKPLDIFGDAQDRFEQWSLQALRCCPEPLVQLTQDIINGLNKVFQNFGFLPSLSDLITSITDLLNDPSLLLNRADIEQLNKCLQNVYAAVEYKIELDPLGEPCCRPVPLVEFFPEIEYMIEEAMPPIEDQIALEASPEEWLEGFLIGDNGDQRPDGRTWYSAADTGVEIP